MQHLADEPPSFHEGDPFVGDESVLQRDSASDGPNVVIQSQSLRLVKPIDVGHGCPERSQRVPLGRQIGALGQGTQAIQQSLGPLIDNLNGLGLSGRSAESALLGGPVRLDQSAEFAIYLATDGQQRKTENQDKDRPVDTPDRRCHAITLLNYLSTLDYVGSRLPVGRPEYKKPLSVVLIRTVRAGTMCHVTMQRKENVT